MPLTTGTRLGSYEILTPIGAGGMGEVYRARDTRLDRDVAIKVLPPQLALDPETLARFEREAKAVAALSHPNILAIHDFGRHGDTSYAAMELLEGETLRERMSTGAGVTPRKVIDIASQIARGLAAAHDRGIVHRDLKPENIFVTTDGRVKILDFGLARPMAAAENSGSNSKTELRATDPGTVLGTVGYMSPEQVRGQTADHRSDIFSLGCVLYELATRRRAFDRDTPAETMTAILREDPPELPRDDAAIPAAVDPVIRHCLEKRPEERFQSAHDLAFALQALTGSSASSGKVDARSSEAAARPRRIPFAFIAPAVGLAVGAFFIGRHLAPASETTQPAEPFAFFQQLTDEAGVETNPAISPDGTSMAYARWSGRKSDIYVQRIGGRNAIAVAADPDRDEAGPVFSPDGATIAFYESDGDGGIFVAGATGESARRVTDFGYHPAWAPDGTRLVFCTEQIIEPASRSAISALWIVDAKGGDPKKILDGDGVQPAWSPSGQRIAYWASDAGQRDLYTIPAAGGARETVTNDAPLDWSPVWAPDGRYLYFSSDRGGTMNIWRVPIDESSGRATGPVEPVTTGVAEADQPRLSKDGSKLVFRSRVASVNPTAVPFDPVSERAGVPRQLLRRTGRLFPTSVSPDGRSLALTNLLERHEDIFVSRIDGTDLRRLTDDAARDRVPVWSPDGKELAFYSNRSGNYEIWTIKPDGSGLRRLTERPGGNSLFPVYAPAGDRMLASEVRVDNVWMLDPRRGGADQSFEQVKTTVPGIGWLVPIKWSPDGRRVAGGVATPSGRTVGLGILDIATRAVKRVNEHATTPFIAWLPDSRRVLYPQEDKLWISDVDSGARREIALSFTPGDICIAAAPDGRTLFLCVADIQADLWLAQRK